jgi:hypothetical protein
MMREREREREEDAFLQEGGCVFTSASLWPMNSWTERERERERDACLRAFDCHIDR